MPTPSDLYVQGLYDRFSYFATWLPNTSIRLGDVGIKRGKYFERVTSLQELRIPFATRVGTSPLEFNHTSQSSVSAQANASGGIGAGAGATLAQAGVVIELSQEGAFVINTMGCLVDEIEDKVALGRKVMDSYRLGDWESEWVVIHTIVKAGSATVLVANSRNARVELSAKADLPISNLADPNAGFAFRSQSGDVTRFLAASGLIPLFKLGQVKKPLFGLLGGEKLTFGPNYMSPQDLQRDEDWWETVAPD